jgi:hypothetical protein
MALSEESKRRQRAWRAEQKKVQWVLVSVEYDELWGPYTWDDMECVRLIFEAVHGEPIIYKAARLPPTTRERFKDQLEGASGDADQ